MVLSFGLKMFLTMKLPYSTDDLLLHCAATTFVTINSKISIVELRKWDFDWTPDKVISYPSYAFGIIPVCEHSVKEIHRHFLVANIV